MRRFNIATASKTVPEQTVIFGSVRVSVLTPYLIRVETGEFTDEATQCVWYRDFMRPTFTVAEKGALAVIDTGKVRFAVNVKSGKVVYIVGENGVKIKNYASGNLRGTRRTLDMCSGAVPLERGLVSRRGVAVLDDSRSLVLKGEAILAREKCTDKYYFAYGNRYRECISDFYKLTGATPLVPKFAFGNWWSRYKAYTQEEYRALMQRFIDEKIPVTVATIDMDWHWVNVTEKFGAAARAIPTDNLRDKLIYRHMSGWTGYSWNTELFPDYRELLKWLNDRNFKVTLNIHPAQGIRFFEDCYKDVCAVVGKDPAKKEVVPFRLGDEKFLEAYFDVVHRPYENEGVRFWWIDWQQGKNSDVPGLDPLWGLNHYHMLDQKDSGKRPLILSRYAGIGSHRYPLGFSGDTMINWRSLRFQPYMTATATNAGYTWWSHDIGGHQRGYKDDELYLRWLQFGVFSPVNRLHSTSNEFMGKEPWKCRGYVEKIAIDYLRFRHRLIPYIYSINYLTHTEGRALCEPMYYSYDEEEAYRARNQYSFGTELVVAPVTEHSDGRAGLAGTDLWVPEGERYTDIFTGRIYAPGKYRIYRDLQDEPVFARAGSIIPLYRNADSNDLSLKQPLEIWLYSGDGSFDMYDDDGDSEAYVKGVYALTRMKLVRNGNKLIFTMFTEGNKRMIPAERLIYLNFRDVVSGKVSVNGARRKSAPNEVEIVYDGSEVTVVIDNCVFAANRDYKEAVTDLVSCFQMSNARKTALFRKVFDIGSAIPSGAPRACREAIEELRCLSSAKKG
ncbi:MAG: DUF5110 domain-containing protein [Firmicutes bacterium]|uniref:DUF5110 domain-containing protein n=1 Tax=Candidatus Stercoripulliclostridium pullicola TaxID=2840953 RepID=A0A940ICV5_9FIRM|nr:DUF5110 domain-containing protein [Candidatus Stercoripulliclostridium pullicola]